MLKKIEGGYYQSTEKLGKQTIQMEFWNVEEPVNPKCKWFVSLIIYTKRKKMEQHFHNCDITGECGAETFIVALRMLQEFEQDIVKEYPYLEHLMCIDGADALRRRIYQHFLPRYGYSKTLIDGRPMMVKKFGITEE